VIEPISALIATFLCYVAWQFVDCIQESIFLKIGLALILSGVFLYFVVRFIQWAWVTPMPWGGVS
jgi:hypothetical protein